ncbi:hypothetical protein O3P69_018567 [Scylla paramamosain]|uniref:Transporter n=1 Tax=Scylla paramamosain TaxID=85552 RepID=A0AAW0T2J4_SCYPA
MKSPIQSVADKVVFWRGGSNINPGFEGEGDGKEKEARVEMTVEETTDNGGRQQWSNPVEFLLSCIAMSVGLGNVWRFPFVALENGGGAFLIPYILVLMFIGKPLYYMELCLGQFSSSGSVKVWDISPAFRGVGYGQAFATWAVVTYYVSLMGLTVFYFFASFSSVLPWSQCGDWASEVCIDRTKNVTELAEAMGKNVSEFTSAAEDYFSREVLQIDNTGLHSLEAPEWRLTLCLLFSWIILFVVLAKGVQSAGKAAYFTALFPYVVLFIMLIRGCTLSGADKGVLYFIKPRWGELLKPKVWYAAVDQSFFSLSLDVDVSEVVKGGGTSLAFVSYPDVLARFDWVPQLFSVLFFLMLFTLGVGSASALTGCIITIICDAFPHFKRWIVTLVVCASGFLLGLFYVTPQGQYILELINYYGGGFIIFILVVFEIAAVHWVYGINNFCRDVEFMLGRKTGYYWKFCWTLLIPILLSVIFIYSQILAEPLKVGKHTLSPGIIGFGIFLAVIACMLLPVFFVIEVVKQRSTSDSFLDAIKNSFKPTSEWCPKDATLRKEYHQFIQKQNEGPQGIDNPAASTADLSSLSTSASKANITDYNTSV